MAPPDPQPAQQSTCSRRILIAMDGSLHCRRALEWYAKFLNHPSDRLLFVYVAEPPPVGIGDGLGMTRSAELFRIGIDKAVGRGRELGALLEEKCVQLGIGRPYEFVERLDACVGAAIVDVAVSEAVDLILMGNRGLGRLRSTFMGSASAYVLHHSHVPVIIVPPEKPDYRSSTTSLAGGSSSSSRSEINWSSSESETEAEP